MKNVSEYKALAPEQIDMSDPDIPESLKIRARIALENAQQQAVLSEAAQKERAQYAQDAADQQKDIL